MESTINSRIEELLKELKMSKNAFAKSIDKTASTINQIVAGRTKPSFEVLEAICDIYQNVNPTWLLKGEGQMIKAQNEVATSSDSYLQDYLLKLEEQFKRVLNQLETKDHQLETKDSQIQNLQEILKMAMLGKADLGENATCEIIEHPAVKSKKAS